MNNINVAVKSAQSNNKRKSSIDVIQSIFNAFSLLQRPCTVAELETLTGIPKSTLYKFLKSLKRINFISDTPDKKYFIGHKIYVYGELYNVNHPRLLIAKSIAEDMANETGLTAQICTIVQGKYMVLHESIPVSAYAISSHILGRNVPITWTASGRLLLKPTNRENLWTLLSEDDLKLPDNKAISLNDLLTDIQLAHAENFAQLLSPINENCVCMATLIPLDNHAQYTLCLSMPADHLKELGPMAKNALIRYRNTLS